MKVPILMYHQIDVPSERGTPLRGLIVAPTSFARQMSFLKLLGYRGLAMRDLEPYLAGERQGKVVGITFDDGFQNNVQFALPVLQKYGFTATCYGVSRAIGGSNHWDIPLGIAQKPLMRQEDWHRWLQADMEIGSHTRSHANLNALSPSQAADEIGGSKEDLESAFGCEVRHFCYPYGWYSDNHKEMVRNAGYQTATTTQRGRADSCSDRFALQRIMVARATHLGLFAAKVLTSYEDRRACNP